MGNILRADVDCGLGAGPQVPPAVDLLGTWEDMSGSAQGQAVWGRVGGGEPLLFLGSQAQTVWAWRWLPRHGHGLLPCPGALAARLP